MGKAALLIAFGASLFIAQGMLSQNETERHTTANQADFEESVIAREIARSGFNVAMGILREKGNNIHAGINAVNQNGGKKYLEGQHQGGTFRARAELKDGNTVRVTSLGYFGGEFVSLNAGTTPEAGWCNEPDAFTGEYYTGGCHSMSDFSADGSPIYEFELPSGDPLTAKLECSKLETRFIESQAGYCSAVFLQRTLPDSTNATPTPEDPEMLFIPGNNRDGQALTIDKYLRGGTQMNFFIGVDKNCSTRPTSIVPVEDFPAFTGDIDNPAPYDHLHYALRGDVNNFGEMVETPWAFTEMHPDGLVSTNDVQRWRIGFEDLHHPEWDNPTSDDPQQSLQALKRLGYDGDGWPNQDGLGYRKLEDYWLRGGASNNGSYLSYRPDFSDQVVEVKLFEETDLSYCGIAAADPDPTPGPDGEVLFDPNCGCPGTKNSDKKVAVWHQEGGSPGKVICIGEPAVNAHLNNHNDHLVCRGV